MLAISGKHSVLLLVENVAPEENYLCAVPASLVARKRSHDRGNYFVGTGLDALLMCITPEFRRQFDPATNKPRLRLVLKN